MWESFTAEVTKLVNLTPHEIKIVVENEETIIPVSGVVARVQMESTEQRAINGKIPVSFVFFNKPGKIEGLPEPEKGKAFIVSLVVLSATDRKDVFAPDTGSTCIRNDKGQIQAVTRLLAARQTKGQCECCGLEDDLAETRPFALCYPCAEGQAESE